MKDNRDYEDPVLGSFNRVSVSREFKDRCYHKGCRHKKVIMVFNDDGRPKMSRFCGQFCEKHIWEELKKAWRDNDRQYKEYHRGKNGRNTI